MILDLDMFKKIGEALQRKASTTCSRWAQNYIVMGKPVPGPMRFEKFPWSIEMLDCDQDWTGKKAAQMAYTNAAIARALFTIDIKKNSVLYILPKKNPDATDFSRTKFDTLLDLSPHIQAMFSNIKNIGHKQAGHVDLFIRGAKSKSGLKSLSVGLRVYDEYDEMPMENVSLADERSSGYATEDKQKITLSTPTIPDFGIDAAFQLSTQEHFMFKCPCCSRMTELVFPDCMVVTSNSLRDERAIRNSYIQCRDCKNRLPHETKIDWLKHKSMGGTSLWENIHKLDSFTRGFHINQLYSMTVAPWEIATLMLKAQFDPADERELYNSKMGMAHEIVGERITDGMIDLLLGDHSKSDPPRHGQLTTMGVDVGKWIHYHIDQWLLPPEIASDLGIGSRAITRHEGKVESFAELSKLMFRFQIAHCVVDKFPETRKAYEFALQHEGRVTLCTFHRGISGKRINLDEAEMTAAVDRTSWLDLSQARFKPTSGPKKIVLPKDLSEEFRTHMKALYRMVLKDPDGNPYAKYVNKGPDHAAFARLYSEIALHLAVSKAENKDVNELI